MEYSMMSLLALVLGISTFAIYNGQNKPPVRKIEGKTVAVIGASSGIGRQTALQFAQKGSNLLLVARRLEQLAIVKAECEQVNPKIKVELVCGDITKETTRSDIQAALNIKFGGVDFLILNAGIISVSSINNMLSINEQTLSVSDSTVSEPHDSPSVDLNKFNAFLDRILSVNFRAPVDIANSLLPYLYRSRGSIVVVSSVAAIISAPTRSIYCASKAALNGYFQSLRQELSKHGVHVALVCPGTVDTDLRSSAVDLSSDTNTHSPVKISGSKTGKASPKYCAEIILDAAVNNKNIVIFPAKYKISVYLNTFFPNLIDYFAKKKYGY
ncbi:hypothetical protein BB561_004124 [Smittium simulii]|uniref:Uncharacterized protein n=1 Tax=Smittium simulii TaxID=133385 RepID=A0A2T9YHU6_9FUNG|nr:hypothetical protein BB561_004124 [Smittium simulii]